MLEHMDGLTCSWQHRWPGTLIVIKGVRAVFRLRAVHNEVPRKGLSGYLPVRASNSVCIGMLGLAEGLE